MKFKIEFIFVVSLVALCSCSRKVYVNGGSGSASGASLTNSQDHLLSSKVSILFDASVGTYTPQSVASSEMNIGTKTCVSPVWVSSGIFNAETMVLDEHTPKFDEHLSLRIVPNSEGIPTDYIFSARVSDMGCGSTELRATCAVWNVTANSDIAYGILKKGEIPDPFVWAPGQTCLSKTGQLTNSFAEFTRHVVDAARVNDRLRFEMHLYDGAGNYSSSVSLDFYKYEKLLGAVGISSLN